MLQKLCFDSSNAPITHYSFAVGAGTANINLLIGMTVVKATREGDPSKDNATVYSVIAVVVDKDTDFGNHDRNNRSTFSQVLTNGIRDKATFEHYGKVFRWRE